MSYRVVFAAMASACFLVPAVSAQAVRVDSPTGNVVSVDFNGQYSIVSARMGWEFDGTVPTQISALNVAPGSDRIGRYQEIAFDTDDSGARHLSIRNYQDRSVVLFSVSYPDAASNTNAFPTFSRYPSVHNLSWTGLFAAYYFGGHTSDSPWLFFDDNANAAVLSPAANFMVANTTLSGAREIATGISPQITSLPAGFAHQTLLAFEAGINTALDTWGQALTDLQGKTRPANDADSSLRLLGYWTDHGATYYYHTEGTMQYDDTLSAVRDDFVKQKLPLGYLQLDSWFYPKGKNSDWKDTSGGIYQYSSSTSVIRSDLHSFQQRMGMPLITHARWIDKDSPYHQKYTGSGNVLTDPLYWEHVAKYLHQAGVETYEQDWLGSQAQTNFNLADGEAFMSNMAAATAAHGLTMQYCMADPHHFLQSSKYSNLTSIRTSEDRFEKTKWTRFLYGSRLASALGAYPFTDVFNSTEADNLLLATLSAGPVGVGDAIASLNRGNLLKSVRLDGVIVKPDAPMVPLDATVIRDAQNGGGPMVASAFSDFGTTRVAYVLAYPKGTDLVATFTPRQLGIGQLAYVYNYFDGSGKLVNTDEQFSASIAGDRSYYVVSPIGSSGMALLGDMGHFVTMGKKRVAQFADNGVIDATLLFASGEGSHTLRGYAPGLPSAFAQKGKIGPMSYDASTQLFSLDVFPGIDGTAAIQIGASALGDAAGTCAHCGMRVPQR